MTVGAAARADPPAPVVRRLVIDARDVRIRYGSHEALRGVDLSVVEGEIVAILGPNGAGKSSLVEILEGFRHRDAGNVSVLGEDPAHAGVAWRARVGVVLQSSEPERHLTVEQCLRLYAGYYPKPRPVPEMLEAALPFIARVYGETAIDLRTKEIAILRVSAVSGCRY